MADIKSFAIGAGQTSEAKSIEGPGILYIFDSNGMDSLQVLFLRIANNAIYNIYKGKETTFTITTEGSSFYVKNENKVSGYILYRYFLMFR